VSALQGASDLEVRVYLRVVSRRKWLIAAVVVVAAAGAYFVSHRQTPRYRSSTSLLFSTSASQQVFNPGAAQSGDPSVVLAADVQVLQGKTVRDLVAKNLGFAASVSAAVSATDDTITLTAESGDPRIAARVANTYAKTYLNYVRDSTVSDIGAAQAAIQSKVNDLQNQINTVQAKISAAPPQSPTLSGLETQQQTLVNALASYQSEISQLQLRADFTGGAQVINPAEVPSFPFAPTPKRSAILAGSLGLLFGISLAFILEFLDDSIKGEEDVERAAPGMPVLASIPVIAGSKKKVVKLVAAEHPSGAAAEAYRTLRTSIQFMGLDKPLRIVQITSPNGGEGKTTTTANLGVVMSTAGREVLVVDCDLRRPRLDECYGIANRKGFTSALIGETPLTSAWQGVQGFPRLKVLTSGPLPPNPAELLSSPRAQRTLAAARDLAGIALVDSPPVLPVTDAVVLSKWVDGTICVVTVGQTTRRDLKGALDQLTKVDATVLGIVLNGTSADGAGYGYGYGSYGQHDARDKKSRRGRRAAKAVHKQREAGPANSRDPIAVPDRNGSRRKKRSDRPESAPGRPSKRPPRPADAAMAAANGVDHDWGGPSGQPADVPTNGSSDATKVDNRTDTAPVAQDPWAREEVTDEPRL
jgi:polysaccharide biosynthesis transport protein